MKARTETDLKVGHYVEKNWSLVARYCSRPLAPVSFITRYFAAIARGKGQTRP